LKAAIARDMPLPIELPMTESSHSPSNPVSHVQPGKQDNRKEKKKDHAQDVAGTIERLGREIGRYDRLLVIVLVLFAFLLASFPARNSDYWLHLATGRFFAEGNYSFGIDPFSYTTHDSYWVNHSWLYDWLLYRLTMLGGGAEAAGGTVAVLLKALAMAGLAGILLLIRRPGQSLFISVLCVGLGMLAMAPRMTLQPVCVSLFFLGLTLYFLAKDGKQEPTAGTKGWRLLFTSSSRRLYVLPALCALWANLDRWFFLGPALIGLYLIGEKTQQALAPERSGPDVPDADEQRCLLWVFVLSLAACLLNPHHVRVFSALPMELFSLNRFNELQGDTRFAWLFVTPFEKKYFDFGTGLNASGLAYFPLLFLGVFSFWLTRTHWRVWRLFIWFVLAVLSATNMLLIPFFAVVAGPITALNLQDFSERADRAPANAAQLRLMLIARRLTLFLGILLLVVAWPGWLGAHPGQPLLARRVGWGIEVDPSLKSVTYKLDLWRTQGLLRPEDHGFNLVPEVAHYCAWFCPEQQGFLDGRLELFARSAAAYKAVRSALDPRSRLPGSQSRGPAGTPNWQQIFRDHGINHVILISGNRESAELVARFLTDIKQWTPLYIDGRASVFSWKDPQKESDPLAKLRLDWRPQAFGADATQAPMEGPRRPPREQSWWEYYASTPKPTIDGDQAAISLVYFERIRHQVQTEHEKGWGLITIASRLAVTDPRGTVLMPLTMIMGQGALHGRYLAQWDLGPAEALMTGIRAGRRAVVDNPDDLDAYIALAGNTHLLADLENHWSRTWLPVAGAAPEHWNMENRWPRIAPETNLAPSVLLKLLEKAELHDANLSPWVTRSIGYGPLLRRIQVLTVLHQILARQPNDFRVHEELFNIYWSMNYFDVALEHLDSDVKARQKAAKRFPEDKELEKALNQREKLLAECEKQVKNLQRNYDFAARSRPAKVKASDAFRPFGLARQALNSLSADLSQLSPEEANLVVYLYLTTGRAEEVRAQMTDKQQAILGTFNYAQFQALAAAALGDYGAADAYLEQTIGAILRPPANPLLDLLQGLTFGQLPPQWLTKPAIVPFLNKQVLDADRAFVDRQRADDLLVLRGLLALEVGDISSASRHFRQALNAPGPRYDFESKPIAVKYLELIQKANH
jgi:hypothetical protein